MEPILITLIFSIGGWTPNDTLKTTETIFPNGHVSNGPVDLPETRAGHCLLEKSGTVISIGGYDPTNHTSYTSTVWMFDANNNFSMTVGPSMKHTRNHHACGIFQSSAHSGKVVSTTRALLVAYCDVDPDTWRTHVNTTVHYKH